MPAIPPKPTYLRVIQLVWVLGYLVGTTTHVVDLLLDGGWAWCSAWSSSSLTWR